MADTMSPDDHAPIKLASFASEMEANVLTNALKRQGVDAITLGGALSGFKAEAPSEVQVVVPSAQYAIATRVMENLDADTVVDWSAVDFGDPTDPSLDTMAAGPVRTHARASYRNLIWFGLAVSLILLAYTIWQLVAS